MLRFFSIFIFTLALNATDVKLQVLGSGGPELDSRASASYVIWIDGKAKILIDFGGGAFVRLGQSGAKLKDIDLILFSHFHIDHVADFAALVKAGYFSERTTPIHVFGPRSNRYFPDTKTFLEEQFEEDKVYGYMSEVLDTNNKGISFIPYVFDANPNAQPVRQKYNGIIIDMIGVNHGNVPSLAYRIQVGGKSITFSGDTSAQTNNLIALAKNSDLFVAHHAIPQHAGKVAKSLHMTPRRIGELAYYAHVKKLLLGHRMNRTRHKENQSKKEIRKKYRSKLILAEDLLVIPLGDN